MSVVSLHVYPVKGLGGIALRAAEATDRGLRHDRRFMVVGPGGLFFTQRDLPKMATVWTEIEGGKLRLSAPDMPEVALEAEPLEGERLQATVWGFPLAAIAPSPDADAWLSEYLGTACRLVYMPETTLRPSNPKYGGLGLVSFADGFAYLAISEASLADLNARLAAKGHPALPMNRFRPNIVLAGAEPYGEDQLGEVRIGEAILRGTKSCGRCQVTTTDQATGEVRGPEPLATLSGYREHETFGAIFGMNLLTVRPGRIAVGDAVVA